MAALSVIIDQMAQALSELKQVLQAEHQQLLAEEINGSLLQRITEEKTSLLATLDYLEQQRKAAAITDHDSQNLQHWHALEQPLQQLRDLNQHNGWLLEGQIERNSRLLEIFRPHLENNLYGADGHTAAAVRHGKKISI